MKRTICIALIVVTTSGLAQPCNLKIVTIPAISDYPHIDASGLDFSGDTSIDVNLSLNEYEPASFIVYNMGPSPCQNIAMKISGFKLGGIPVDDETIHADIKYVKRWMQAGGAWKNISPHGNSRYIPELLLNDDSLVRVDKEARKNELKILGPGGINFVNISDTSNETGRLIHDVNKFRVQDADGLLPLTIEAGDIRQIWITFHATHDAPIGKYEAVLSARNGNQTYFRIPIKVNVLPIRLEDPNILYSIFYRGVLVEGEGSISSEYKSEQQFTAELENMKRHGICCPVLYQYIGDRPLFEKSMMLRKQVFGKNQSLFMTGLSASIATTKDMERYLKSNIDYLITHQKEFGVDQYYLFGKDEAKGDALLAQKSSWALVKKEGLKIFATGYAGTFEKTGSLLDVLVLAGKPRRSEIDSFQLNGGKVFTYAFPQSGPENPLLFRKNYGLKMWQEGMDGVMDYAYQESFQSTWNDFDHPKLRDHNFTYPTVNGVIDTIAWEGFREGIDDVRYVTTLEKKLTKYLHPTEGVLTQKCINSLENTRDFLSDLKNKPLKNLDKLRSDIVRYIFQLDVTCID